MAAVTVGCHTNKVFKKRLFAIQTLICKEKKMLLRMTTDSDGCHVGYLYDI